MSDPTIYYLYSKSHYHYLGTTTRPVDSSRVGSTTTSVPEDGWRRRYYKYDPENDTWTFDLDLYKETRLRYVAREYTNFVDSYIACHQRMLLQTCLLLANLVIVLRNDLDYTEYTSLVDQLLNNVKWLDDVYQHFQEVLESIEQAESADDVDNTVEQLSFEQFEQTLSSLNLSEIFRQLLALLGSGSSSS